VLGAWPARFLRPRQNRQSADRRRRIDELFAIERGINGKPPDVRRTIRQHRSKPLVAALERYMREQLAQLSPKNEVAKAIRYRLTRWPSFTRFLNDGLPFEQRR
jgi:hypothetical protein